MEEISEALDAFLSGDNEIRNEAESFLNQKIMQDPLFYQAIFILYTDFSFVKKKLALILIKTQIKKNPSSISTNFSDFTQRLMLCVQNESNIELYLLLSDIIIQIALRCKEIWPDFQVYLTLFVKNKDFLPLCLYIFAYFAIYSAYLKKYSPLIVKVSSALILNSMKYPHIKVKTLATSIFCQNTKKVKNPEDFEKYKPFCELLYSIAESSIDFNEEDFNDFWTRLYEINPCVSEPFYLLDRTFLQNEKLSPHSRSILIQFIFKNLVHVEEEEYDDLIKLFFNIQTEVEDIDSEGYVFNFLHNSVATYPYVKNCMLEFITSKESKCKEVGLALLKSFYFSYSKIILNDISEIIDAVLSVESISQDDLHYILVFFESINDFNSDDSNKVFNFLIDVITNFQQSDVQKSCLNIFKQLFSNSYFFDKLLEIQPQIQLESVPLYLNLLTQIYLIDSNLANEKYDKFFDSIIEISNQAFQKAKEMISEYEDKKDDFDKYDEFDFSLNLCGSCAIFITFFNFFIPYKFEDILQSAIDSIFTISQYNNIFDDYNSSSLINIDDEFAEVFLLTKSIYIDYVRPHYEFLATTEDFEMLKESLIEIDGTNCPFLPSIIENFNKKCDYFTNLKNADLEELITFIVRKVVSVSQWIYKFLDEDFHLKYLNIIKFAFINLGPNSHDVMKELTESLKTMVSQKRLKYYKENNVEWYPVLIENINTCAMYSLEEVILKKSEKSILDSFVELSNLISVFIRINNDFGHELFIKFLMPSYQSNPGLYGDKLLDTFSEMLKNEYCNKDELEIIIQVVDNIINENLNYVDVRYYIYDILWRLSKIDIEIGTHYIKHALDEFNSTKEEDAHKVTRSSIAIFLLGIFNADTQKFNQVLELLPDILSLFPPNEIHLFVPFINEMDILIQKNNQVLSKEAVESLMAAYLRFFSYLSNSAALFDLDDEKFKEIFQTLKGILDSYISEFKDLTYQSIVSNILSEQPASIEYVMSLLSQ